MTRVRLGMGQAELARKLCTNQSTISRIEKGNKPRDYLTIRIIEFLKHNERRSEERIDKIVEAIAYSEEFRALITRITTEF